MFRYAKRHRLIYTDPTSRLTASTMMTAQLPLTDAEVVAIQQIAATPAQRLVIALTAVHAVRPAAIRQLRLDDVDLPNRRITLAGHPATLGDLTYRALETWLQHRRTLWPHTPNPHVLISTRTALTITPVTEEYLKVHLVRRGVDLARIRADRILQEALAVGPDPLHLTMMFNLSHAAASRYSTIAGALLDDAIQRDGRQRTHPETVVANGIAVSSRQRTLSGSEPTGEPSLRMESPAATLQVDSSRDYTANRGAAGAAQSFTYTTAASGPGGSYATKDLRQSIGQQLFPGLLSEMQTIVFVAFLLGCQVARVKMFDQVMRSGNAYTAFVTSFGRGVRQDPDGWWARL